MFVKHQRLRTQYQSTTHQLLIHHPFTGTFTGTKNITNPLDSSPHLRRAGPCVRLTALTSLRQPNARAATVWFMAGPCCFPSRMAETTMRSFRPRSVHQHRPSFQFVFAKPFESFRKNQAPSDCFIVTIKEAIHPHSDRHFTAGGEQVVGHLRMTKLG